MTASLFQCYTSILNDCTSKFKDENIDLLTVKKQILDLKNLFQAV